MRRTTAEVGDLIVRGRTNVNLRAVAVTYQRRRRITANQYGHPTARTDDDGRQRRKTGTCVNRRYILSRWLFGVVGSEVTAAANRTLVQLSATVCGVDRSATARDVTSTALNGVVSLATAAAAAVVNGDTLMRR